MAKLYAVRKGREIGIFKSWGECEKQVKGFPGAEYKSFIDEDEANEFLSVSHESKPAEEIAVKSSQAVQGAAENSVSPSPDRVVVYVDGSYNWETNMYGYGVYMNCGGKERVLYGSGQCKEKGRNVEGEIAGARAALEYIKNSDDPKNVVMYYDYQGIGSWADGDWKANKEYTRDYARFVRRCREDGMSVEYLHVKGHTGNEGNEYVDKIAKLSCGVDLTNAERAMLLPIKDVPGMPSMNSVKRTEPKREVDCSVAADFEYDAPGV